MQADFEARRPKVEVKVFWNAYRRWKTFVYVDNVSRYIATAPERYMVSYNDPRTGQTLHVSGEDFLRQTSDFPRSRQELREELRARRKGLLP
jgi:hypothetical protein